MPCELENQNRHIAVFLLINTVERCYFQEFNLPEKKDGDLKAQPRCNSDAAAK